MGIETVAEELVGAGAIALADGSAGVVEGPAGQGDAEGDEGFFFEAAGEFLPAIFVVEISEQWSAKDGLGMLMGNSRVAVERGGERCVGHLGLRTTKIRRKRDI